MDVVTNDPALVPKMIELLATELKTSGQGLRESQTQIKKLEEENLQLKRELDTLRLQVQAMLDSQDHKSELLSGNPYATVCAQLAATQVELEDSRKEHAEALDAMKIKLKATREK
ncbi:uncharacterized protein FIBRA_02975 [Fibroporia radiculosa]|uniref:Uncharacterized protein n=1 Tax=Fibroporia radiculosa TaxID=599839 RepID=J4G3P0_9APHY|nr:uncharacterized protein FIBRA_02975 [Fibroporia radiculosa]CCM00928.1 predicted protein [Fibroporia radiculosa]